MSGSQPVDSLVHKLNFQLNYSIKRATPKNLDFKLALSYSKNSYLFIFSVDEPGEILNHLDVRANVCDRSLNESFGATGLSRSFGLTIYAFYYLCDFGQ